MKVAIQLYSVRESMAKDVVQTIRDVANAGYHYLEVANHNALEDPGVGFKLSALELNNLLKEIGARVIGAHVAPLTMDNIDAVLDYHSEIGNKYISYPMGFFNSAQHVKEVAIQLNEIGKKCKERGIQLLYHNHFHEFMNIDGEMIFEILMQNSEPENLGIELDTFWAMRGGQDPVALLEKYGKRVKLIHQKDFNPDSNDDIVLIDKYDNDAKNVSMQSFGAYFTEESFIEIGLGCMDIQSIIDAAKKYCDVDYIVLEQDCSQHNDIDSIKISMENFKKFKGISFD